MNRPSLAGRCLALALVTTAAAGCAQTTQGHATPGVQLSTPSTNRAKPPTTTASSKAVEAGPLAGTEPCDLMPEAIRAALGININSAPQKLSVAYGRGCQFADTNAGVVAGVTIYDLLGPDKEVVGATDRKPVSAIGRHQTQQWMFAGSCTFSLTIGPKSTVDVSASDYDTNDQRSCEIAMKAARLIEPNLP